MMLVKFYMTPEFLVSAIQDYVFFCFVSSIAKISTILVDRTHKFK